MAFFTCFLVLSGGALAADYMFEVPAVLDIDSDDVYLADSDLVAVASLASVSGGFTVSANNPISYGISGGLSESWSSGATYDGSIFTLAVHEFDDESGSSYLSVPNGTYIDLTYDIAGAYPDVDKVDFWGTFDGTIGTWFPGGTLSLVPDRYDLLIDGKIVATYTEPKTTFKYTHTLDVGDSVSTFGIRYYYQEHFDLGAFGEKYGGRWLLMWQPEINTNVAQSRQGFFHSLFSWLGNIRDGISSGFSNLVSAVTALPSKIADAIKGLFVPTDAQLEELKGSFNDLLSEKLGFVYQSVALVDGVFDAVFDAVDNPNSDVSFTVPAFPSFAVGGVDVSLWDEPITVDISDNEVVQTVQTVASPFVVAVMVWGFVHSMEEAFLAFAGGQSLANWIRTRKEGAE